MTLSGVIQIYQVKVADKFKNKKTDGKLWDDKSNAISYMCITYQYNIG